MFKKLGVLVLAAAIAVTGCAKVIKPADKPMYDRATAAIDAAKAEIKLSEKSPTLKDLSEMFNSAKSYLSTAEEWLEKGQFLKAIDLANKSTEAARNVRELPIEINNIIAETERNLQLAKEVGMDKMVRRITGPKLSPTESNLALENLMAEQRQLKVVRLASKQNIKKK